MIFLTVVLLAILSLGAVSAQEANDSLQLDSSDNFILNDDSTAPVNNDKAVYVETDGDVMIRLSMSKLTVMIQDQVVKIARMLQ